MNNLVPQLRADKNGKLVTRHVNADPASSLSKSSIPAPAAPQPKVEPSERQKDTASYFSGYLDYALEKERHYEPNEDADEDLDDWDEGGLDYSPSALISPEAVKDAILKLPEHTVERIADKKDKSLFNDDYVIAVLHALDHDSEDARLLEYLTYFHNNVDELSDDEDWLGHEDTNSFTIVNQSLQDVDRISHLGYTPPDDIFNATQEEAQRFKTINAVFQKCHDPGTDIIKEDLLKLVIDNPSREDELTKLILDDYVTDVDYLQSRLNTAAAVADGTL